MYTIVGIISIIIRQWILPNPFECFGWLISMGINAAIAPILHLVAYKIVGMVYEGGSAPAIGSILYLIVYASIIGILALMGIFSFAWWWVLIIFIAMLGIYFGLNALADKLSL